jgi:histidinol-phosphate/aromatic aminotransferase/cobyric acid decarboxylase-like protein
VLATSDAQLLKTLYSYLPVWNINSFAEYFMQINGSYEKEYIESCNNIARQRKIMIEHLQKISYLKVYESQANYIMCKVTSGITSIKLASKLLKEYNILIKDLSKKKGFFKKNYIRLAVKDESQNILLYNALLKIEKEIKNLDITP